MSSWTSEFYKGRRHLCRHRVESALGHFNKAIKDCPVGNSRELARMLFYAGLALRKLGMTDRAVKSWCASWELNHSTFLDRHIKRDSLFGSCDDADWTLFYAVQLERYLGTKRSRCPGSLAEQDMIRDLIQDAWADFRRAHKLAHLSQDEKIKMFRTVRILFPMILPGGFFESRSTSSGPGPGGRSFGYTPPSRIKKNGLF